jgi:hypothetical protein
MPTSLQQSVAKNQKPYDQKFCCWFWSPADVMKHHFLAKLKTITNKPVFRNSDSPYSFLDLIEQFENISLHDYENALDQLKVLKLLRNQIISTL